MQTKGRGDDEAQCTPLRSTKVRVVIGGVRESEGDGNEEESVLSNTRFYPNR